VNRRAPYVLLLAALVAGTLFVSAASPRAAAAQEPPAGPSMPVVPGLQQNAANVLEARGDTLYVGPCLNRTTDGGASFSVLTQEGRLCASGSPVRIASLDVEGDVLFAGLGRAAAGGVSAAEGFLRSRDGGATFTARPPQLDAGVDSLVQSGADSLVQYGPNLLPTLPVVTPDESTPFAVDYVDSTDAVWVAGRASGLRRSTDGGQTFERIVLPPDSLDAIAPFRPYGFPLLPKRGEGGPGSFNHIVSSVLVDETGTVWAGASRGVNRSRPRDVIVFRDPESGECVLENDLTDECLRERAWRRFGYDNTDPDAPAAPDTLGEGLSGNFVPILSEQPLSGRRNPVWMSTRTTVLDGEEGGVTFTRDGGETFYQTLLGEEINAFAFRGDTVYAAGERGLFISEGSPTVAGDSVRYEWRLENDFEGAGLPDAAVANELPVFAVATTDAALWAGAEDGLLRSTDGGETWEAFRTRVPTDPEEPTEAVPQVATYAYPNPFSPVAAPTGVVRIVAETDEAGGGGTATVQLYDFAMRAVRELTGDCDAGGRCEVVWDGTDAGGARVSNGVYFYEIDLPGADDEEAPRGKIMVLE
jgi:photosystem II stability/assembly factor-like uncharacterized protein